MCIHIVYVHRLLIFFLNLFQHKNENEEEEEEEDEV